MFCHQTVEVWDGIFRIFTCKVGSFSQLDLFSVNKNYIHDIKKKLGR